MVNYSGRDAGDHETGRTASEPLRSFAVPVQERGRGVLNAMAVMPGGPQDRLEGVLAVPDRAAGE